MSARDDLLRFAKDLADPDWSLSVPKPAKDTIARLVKIIEDSKPRTITTAEELDALAEACVVLDRYGVANQLVIERITEGPAERYWDTTGHDRHSSVALPATVLHEASA